MAVPNTRPSPSSAHAVEEALRVSYATVGWSTTSGAASVVVGLRSGSLSLGGLGASILVDVLSSLVLIHRFRLHRSSRETPTHAERRAQVVAAAGLIVIGASLAATGSERLVAGSVVRADALPLALAAASVLALPALARWKYRAAAAVGSRALHTDAHITAVGAGTAALTLLGLLLTRALSWWWADSGAALLIAAVAANEGRRALAAREGADRD